MEYSTVVAPASVAKVAYTTTDHLGSPRVITDALGQVASRRDFMPFGEDLNVGVGNRTGDTGLKYSMPGDNIRQKFTGYQKDNETQLDFAEARMYENRYGRFTTVDPLLASGKSANPQTFNRYSYTGNNPVNRTDPKGLDWCRKQGSGVQNTGWVDGACAEGYDTVNKQELILAGGSLKATNGVATPADRVRFNSNGTVTIVYKATASQLAQATGTEVQAGQEEIRDGNATGQATVRATVTPRTPIPLPPCVPGMQCLDVSEPSPTSLNTGATDEDFDQAQLALDVLAATEIPVVSQGAGALSSLIDLSRGDPYMAGLGVAGLLPIVGNFADGAKITRGIAKVADKVSDVAKRGPSLNPNAPHNKTIRSIADSIEDGRVIAGGRGPEKLIATPGGIKSGRRPDILVERFDGSKYGINVGKQTKKGLPYKREREAIWDLEGAGYQMFFVPYN